MTAADASANAFKATVGDMIGATAKTVVDRSSDVTWLSAMATAISMALGDGFSGAVTEGYIG